MVCKIHRHIDFSDSIMHYRASNILWKFGTHSYPYNAMTESRNSTFSHTEHNMYWTQTKARQATAVATQAVSTDRQMHRHEPTLGSHSQQAKGRQQQVTCVTCMS